MHHLELLAGQVAAYTKSNPVVGGVVGMWGLGVATLCLKTIPTLLSSVFYKQFTVTMTLHNQDLLFTHVIKWYDKKGYGKKSRTIKAQNGATGMGEVVISAGYGNHYFMNNFRMFRISRTEETSSNAWGTTVKEKIELTTIGRSQNSIRDMIGTIVQETKNPDKTSVYEWRENSWQHVVDQVPRAMDSVFMPAESKKKLLDSVKQFKDDKEFYQKNGIPYRLGILLYGPPGTGKTSMVRALAGHLQRHLNIVTLNAATDEGLARALASTGDKNIVLMEDVDVAGVVTERKAAAASAGLPKPPKPKSGDDKTEALLSLSGLLNAIDGVLGGDGRILVMTTNDVAALDPALIRRGRTDVVIEMGYLTNKTFRDMLQAFYPGEIVRDWELKKNTTASEVQGAVLSSRGNMQAVVDQFTSSSHFRKAAK